MISMHVLSHKFNDAIQETSPTKTCPGRDPLINGGGPMTRSRAKQVNQVIGLLVQSTIDDTSIFMHKKKTSFMFGSKVETIWINTIQTAEVGARIHNCAIASLIAPCNHMVVYRKLGGNQDLNHATVPWSPMWPHRVIFEAKFSFFVSYLIKLEFSFN